jgi:hypothetical protein
MPGIYNTPSRRRGGPGTRWTRVKTSGTSGSGSHGGMRPVPGDVGAYDTSRGSRRGSCSHSSSRSGLLESTTQPKAQRYLRARGRRFRASRGRKDPSARGARAKGMALLERERCMNTPHGREVTGDYETHKGAGGTQEAGGEGEATACPARAAELAAAGRISNPKAYRRCCSVRGAQRAGTRTAGGGIRSPATCKRWWKVEVQRVMTWNHCKVDMRSAKTDTASQRGRGRVRAGSNMRARKNDGCVCQVGHHSA